MNYRLAYAIGFHPWEELAEHPPFAGKLLELVAREEDGHEPPYGRALDLGSGSAVWGVRLALRGWEVTCVDIVDKALRRARARADEAGAEVRLLYADVTALREADLGSGFRLLLDTGTFHGLNDAQREAMGREVSAVAAPDATLILDCFAPRHRGPLPGGASRADVERAFPGWEITDVEVADTEPDALARLMRFDERFYRLRRTVEQPQRASTDQDDAEELEAISIGRVSRSGSKERVVEDHAPPMTGKDASSSSTAGPRPSGAGVRRLEDRLAEDPHLGRSMTQPVRIDVNTLLGITLREGFDYITTPNNWPQYGRDLVRIEPGSRWQEPGTGRHQVGSLYHSVPATTIPPSPGGLSKTRSRSTPT